MTLSNVAFTCLQQRFRRPRHGAAAGRGRRGGRGGGAGEAAAGGLQLLPGLRRQVRRDGGQAGHLRPRLGQQAAERAKIVRKFSIQ